MQSLRLAARRLLGSPGFTLSAIVSLALGVGANTAIFSLVDAILLRPSSVASPEELVEVYVDQPGFAFGPFSYPDFAAFRAGTTDAFSGVAASGLALIQVDRDQGVSMVAAETVSGNYFALLGVRPEVGRLLSLEDDVAPGAHPVVVLGNRYWQREHGGDPGAVGQQMRLNGHVFTIIGVAPPSFEGTLKGISPDLFTPLMMLDQVQPSGAIESSRLEQRTTHFLFVRGRLAPGAILEQARTAAAAVGSSLVEEGHQDWREGKKIVLVPHEEIVLHPVADRVLVPALGIAMLMVGLVLLIACANLASFLLARAMDRRKEIALRLALGASRRRLVGQLLTETVLLALVGGGLGAVLAWGLMGLIQGAELPLPIPITLNLELNGAVLGFNLAISALAGVLFGLLPALQSTRPDLASTLGNETAGGGQRGRLRLRNILVAGQLAVCLVLLLGSGLFLRSLQASSDTDPGFGRKPAGLMTLWVPQDEYDDSSGRRLARTFAERVGELPGVTAVGMIDSLHLSTTNTQTTGIRVEGVPPPEGQSSHYVDFARVDPDFFEAAGVRLLNGRNFTELDTADAPRVAIVSEALARRFWPGEDPLGRVLQPPGDPELRVVGIAGDTKVRSLGEAPRPFLYMPYSQSYSSFMTLVARTEASPERLTTEMLALARRIVPEAVVYESKTLEQHLATLRFPWRLGAFLMSAFAGLALVLACVGLYGLVSYAVAQRRREVGIHMSLGATPAEVVRLLLGSGLRPILIGGGIGLLLGVAAGRLLSSFLFGVKALDPVTFVVVPLVLGIIAVTAAYVPAHRASRIDPVKALSSD